MRILSLCLLVSALVFSHVPVANAGLLDFLFPEQKDAGPHPSETLRAPFADQDAVIEDMDDVDNRQNSMPLDQKHRTNNVMIKWLQSTIPELISYKGEGYQDQYKEKVVAFSKGGADNYVSFLHGANYITTLKTGNYDVTGFIQDYPIVINEGVVDGRYQWVFQTSVMVTYLDAGMSEYKKGAAESVTQEYVLTFHLGRVDGVKNEHGVLIESWEFKKK